MPKRTLINQTIQYILERQCKAGGFCFYRLEEPNGSDTFFALAALDLLGMHIISDATIRFLQQSQKPDCTYDNLYQAFYAIRGLRLLGKFPLADPRPYIETQIRHFPVENATLETQLRRLNLLTDLCEDLSILIPPKKRESMIALILSYQNKDGGFGAPPSSLLTTAYAVSCLKKLSYPLTALKTVRFLRACENPVHGFLNVPDMAPSFLEHILAGITISYILKYTPRYTEVCHHFVAHCQSQNGGFARSPGGLPTLQDTFNAIFTLTLLDKIKQMC